MTMTENDDWVRAAITDDNIVVELLVRLKQVQAAPPAPKPSFPALKWGIRQPRSRAMSSFRCDAKRDGGDFNVGARGSPTTPLCWSGGSSSDASPSAAEGFEETSTHLLRSPPSRSKGTASGESNRTSSKRSRRRKTFAELKEEENLLLKERVHLKKEIESTLENCKEHRAMNQNLKRIRLDRNSNTAKNSSLIADEHEKEEPCLRVASSSFGSTSRSEAALDGDRKPSLGRHNVGKATRSEKSLFVLPDLNMVPGEDDSGPETLYGTS